MNGLKELKKELDRRERRRVEEDKRRARAITKIHEELMVAKAIKETIANYISTTLWKK